MIASTPKLAARLMLVALFAIFVFQCHAACPAIKGRLKGLEHGVGGTLSIGKACGLKVSGFKYDGQAPAVYWWAAPSCNYVDIVKNGYRISNTRIAKAYTGSTTVGWKLNSGVKLSGVGCIVLYCEDFKADLGHVAV